MIHQTSNDDEHGWDGDAPRIEVARGVVRIEADISDVETAIGDIEQRLDRIEERARAFGAQSRGPDSSGEHRGAERADPSFTPPTTENERIIELLGDQLSVLQSIYEIVRSNKPVHVEG